MCLDVSLFSDVDDEVSFSQDELERLLAAVSGSKTQDSGTAALVCPGMDFAMAKNS